MLQAKLGKTFASKSQLASLLILLQIDCKENGLSFLSNYRAKYIKLKMIFWFYQLHVSWLAVGNLATIILENWELMFQANLF